MQQLLKRVKLGNQVGYTLIELIVIIAILGTITTVMAMTINMALKLTTADTAQNILLSQVHQAASWIAKDVASADNITTDSGTVLCSIKRYVWNQVDNITATTTIDYVVSNSNLLRKVNGSPGSIVAQYIQYPDTDTSFTIAPSSPYQSNAYLLKLKAVYGNSSYKQQFKLYQRLP
jgi:type II secretory pathway pseudopilin PulG